MKFRIILKKNKKEMLIHLESMYVGSYDEFEAELAEIVLRERAEARVINSVGNEVFTLSYAPQKAENMAFCFDDKRKLQRFIDSF